MMRKTLQEFAYVWVTFEAVMYQKFQPHSKNYTELFQLIFNQQ